MADKIRVTVLHGGISAEREVSLESGRNVAAALTKVGFDVTLVDVDENFVSEVPPIDTDIVFIALHGKYGEDGQLQQVLEKMKIPFTGSSSLASKRGMDKVESRRLFRLAGLNVAPALVICENDRKMEGLLKVELPVVVKPSREGSTFGVTVVHCPEEFEKAIDTAFLHDNTVLVEKFIRGREFTVGIISNMALPVIEIRPKHEIFDFKCKYGDDLADFSFDHGLSLDKISFLVQCARDAYNAIECSGIARVDLILGADGKVYLLEVNTIPGMTCHSLVPLAAKRLGIKMPELCKMAVTQVLRPKNTTVRRR